MKPIYIILWSNDSGDSGVVDCYFTVMPEKEGLDLFMQRNFPHDFEAETLHYSVKKLYHIE